jgi:hypothetical protein
MPEQQTQATSEASAGAPDQLRGRALASLLVMAGLAVAACTPTVQLQAPKDPITINLNIQADVRVRIEEAAQKDIESNPDIFGE